MSEDKRPGWLCASVRHQGGAAPRAGARAQIAGPGPQARAPVVEPDRADARSPASPVCEGQPDFATGRAGCLSRPRGRAPRADRPAARRPETRPGRARGRRPAARRGSRGAPARRHGRRRSGARRRAGRHHRCRAFALDPVAERPRASRAGRPPILDAGAGRPAPDARQARLVAAPDGRACGAPPRPSPSASPASSPSASSTPTRSRSSRTP